MERFYSVQSKLLTMAYNISGLTLAALTNRTIPSFQQLSTPCFVGIVMRLNATYIYQTFRQIIIIKPTCLCNRGSQPSKKVGGLPVVGPFKSLSLRHQLSSFRQTANDSETRNHWSDRYMR